MIETTTDAVLLDDITLGQVRLLAEAEIQPVDGGLGVRVLVKRGYLRRWHGQYYITSQGLDALRRVRREFAS